MNSPEADRGELSALRDPGARFGESVAQLAGDLARKMHVKPLLADAPGDELTGAREIDGEKAVDCKARWLRGNEISGAAIGKDREGEQLLQFLSLLHVQGAELEREEQDFRIRFGANDVPGCLKRVDGCVAAHESNKCTLDRRIELGKLDNFVVETGCVESRAAGDDDVGDALA